MKIRIIILSLLMIMFNLFNKPLKADTLVKTPDFRYPETVSKDAQKSLKQAIAQRNANDIVLSLVQIGLAKTSVSRKNYKEVCDQIDAVLAQEDLLTPDYRSILYLVEAQIVNRAPYDISDDVAYTGRILYEKALDPLGNGDISALQHPLSDYKDVVTLGSELGQRCVPTLYDFVMLCYCRFSYLGYEERQKWLSQHLLDKDIMPRLYIEQYIADGSTISPWDNYTLSDKFIKLYEKYASYPESGLFLINRNVQDKDYPLYKDYIKRHPESQFTKKVRNIMAQIEDCRVEVSYPSVIQSTDAITVTATSRNVNEMILTLYRLPKSPSARNAEKMNVSDFIPVQQRVVKTEGVVPFNANDLTATFDPVPFGQYIVLASYDTPKGRHAEQTLHESYVYSSMISVSDLRTFHLRPQHVVFKDNMQDAITNDPLLFFAVNSQTGEPVQGATITYKQSRNYSKNEPVVLTTDKDGSASLDKHEAMSYTVTKGEDRFLPAADDYNNGYDQGVFRKGIETFTDLGIYRPGEDVRLSVVAWSAGYCDRKPTANLKLKIDFRDASRNEISTQEVTTDAFGQALATFNIPTDRMNGSFQFNITSVDSKIHYSAYRSIEVSEYKTPTFYVDLTSTLDYQLVGEQVRIKGRVMTYSGMPVADTEVECRLTARPWLWWYNESNFESHTFTVKTDKEGNIDYLCPADWTETKSESGARRPYLTYTISATCTNAAGETHVGSRDFWIGHSRGISCNDATLCLENGKEAPYKISFLTTDPEEKSVACHYQLCRVTDKDTVVVKEEDFKTDAQHFNWDKIPSGKYLLRANIIGEEVGEQGRAEILIYRESDALPPVASPLWTTPQSQKMDEDGHVRMLVGTTTGSHIYYIISSKTRIERQGWLYYTPGMHWFEADMPKALDEVLNIHFYTIRDGKSYHEQGYFRAPWCDEVNLRAVTFRDKLQPGSHEHWSFSFTDQNGQPVKEGRMMLELYNEALHTLAPNNWSLGISTYGYTMFSHRTPAYGDNNTYLNYIIPRVSGDRYDITMPELYLYDHEFFSELVKSRAFNGIKERMAAGIMVDDDAMPMAMSAAPMMSKMAVAEEAEAVADADNAAEKPTMKDIAVRDAEVKVALWQPQLTTDAEGNFSVEFDVPNFNTTWRMQALAYSKNMNRDMIVKQILAQRPVMVQASLPRFLRAGDAIELAANVMNATDSVLTVDALIELFDPRTNEVVETLTKTLQMDAKATEVLRISYAAPHDAPYIGFRVKALSEDGNGDGEQQLLPILTNITPVIETQPFYMQPQTGEMSLDVLTPAAVIGNDRLTLEYCNNPTWYCVTALPTIIDTDAITSPALAHNLFAIALAAKLSAENPRMAEAIRSWKQKQGKEGDVLVSPLQTNDDLKISPLLASPWLPEAQRQQLRMQALDQLFDGERNAKIIDKIITSLKRLQAKDGGFLWLDFNGDRDEASYWATGQVLELLGEVHRLGCLPDDATLRTLISEALHYYDKETIRLEEEMLKDAKKYDYKPSYMQFWGYVATRQLLTDLVAYNSKSEGKSVFRIIDKTLKELEQRWGELPMTDRALAAVTLYRYEHQASGRAIMESVRQFALHDPHKGMYWESLDRYSYFSPVACTSAMLQAFAEVSPRQEELDEMREWLLLEKQTSDWGSSSMASDAVYALLSTGTDWLHASVNDSVPQFEIRVDGKAVEVADVDRHLGYIRMSLPADAKRVEVTRTGVNPAWGSLYHQYQAPMTEVKAQGVEELNITKQFVRVDVEGKTHKLAEGDSIHVGDRIRTVLKVNATKALEYVTLIDQRPAFLEPVDQTSHYTRADRFYYYLETKDNVTNAFITRLPEGVHELSYDCFVTAPGTFTSGIATIQSQYAPQFVAHSAGAKIATHY